DIVFLLSLIDRPNYDYLKMKLDVTNAAELKARILERCSELDMQEMARDVAPFLFNPADVKKIVFFSDYIQQVPLQ
ncbi:MAG: hypothetical protein ACXVMS_18820, partial [Flavisolibacter sp.]